MQRTVESKSERGCLSYHCRPHFQSAPAGTAPAGQRRSGRRSGNTLPASSLPQRPMGSIHRLPRCHKADAFIWQRYATCNGCIVRSASCCRWKPGPPPPGFRVLSQDGATTRTWCPVAMRRLPVLRPPMHHRRRSDRTLQGKLLLFFLPALPIHNAWRYSSSAVNAVFKPVVTVISCNRPFRRLIRLLTHGLLQRSQLDAIQIPSRNSP